MIELLVRYLPALLQGLGVTAALTVIVWSLGVAGGVAFGALAHHSKGMENVLKTLSLLVAATPILVILMWAHYPAQSLLDVVIDPFVTSAVALSLVNIIFVADVVRRGLGSLPDDWTISARTSGLSQQETMRFVTLPLAFRQLLGPVIFIQIAMLHATLFTSLISVDELFRTVQRINAVEYRPVELYSFLALFFLLVCAPLYLLASAANRRYAADTSLR